MNFHCWCCAVQLGNTVLCSLYVQHQWEYGLVQVLSRHYSANSFKPPGHSCAGPARQALPSSALIAQGPPKCQDIEKAAVVGCENSLMQTRWGPAPPGNTKGKQSVHSTASSPQPRGESEQNTTTVNRSWGQTRSSCAAAVGGMCFSSD